MFFEPDRIFAFRQMIVAKTEDARRTALEKILPMQREDFIGIFKIMKGKPGFILSPVDNVREWSPEIERNVRTLIAAWQGERGSSRRVFSSW